jgi:mannose-6-phosphate isomerase-like protein (cupin superfamily)
MNVIQQARPAPVAIPGIAHATWASADDGLTQISIWRQTLALGAATPPHHHDCDEVVMCQSGCGELHVDGEVQHFAGNCTIVLPRGKTHQIFNTGSMPMELLAAFGATPVGTFLPDGEAIALPWRT